MKISGERLEPRQRVAMSLLDPCRTRPRATHMSAFGPKQT